MVRQNDSVKEVKKEEEIFRCVMYYLGAVMEKAIGNCEKDGGGDGMIEILRCVICAFRNILYHVPQMIHGYTNSLCIGTC